MTILFKPDNIFHLLDGKLGFVTAWGCRETTALERGQRCGDESLSALLPGWFEGNIH